MTNSPSKAVSPLQNTTRPEQPLNLLGVDTSARKAGLYLVLPVETSPTFSTRQKYTRR